MERRAPRNEEAPAMGVARASDSNQHPTEGEITMNTSTNTAISHPVIAGHEIATDEHGRFNLNAIHRASDAGKGSQDVSQL